MPLSSPFLCNLQHTTSEGRSSSPFLCNMQHTTSEGRLSSPFLATCSRQHRTQVRSDVELVVRTIPRVGNYGPPSATPSVLQRGSSMAATHFDMPQRRAARCNTQHRRSRASASPVRRGQWAPVLNSL